MPKSRLLATLLALLCVLAAMGQRTVHVVGRVITDRDLRPVEMATVRLLALPDSALLDGVLTDSIGRFALTTPRSGRAVLSVSYIGLPALQRTVELPADRDTLDLATLALRGEDIALRAATVRATLARVEQREDTTIFNAAAFRTPEGSTLEALVKQLPGAEVSEDGTIKINGKTVKEFLINGKDFFKGDTKVAMKNLPTNLVSKLKTYDKKSDYTEQTGVDDGEESFVLDISTKRELNQSFVSNMDLAGGWDYGDTRLYSTRLFASRFTDRSRITFFGSHNNVGDRGFGGPRGFGSGGGITTSTMTGMDFSWDNGRKNYTPGRFEVGGNVLFFRSDNDTESTTASETFLSSAQRSFSNSHSRASTLSRRIHSRLRLRWSPDSLTALSFRPSMEWSNGLTHSRRQSATFDDDPFERYGVDNTDDVLAQAFRNAPSASSYAPTGLDDFLVNINQRTTRGKSRSHTMDGTLELTRRIGTSGRNISLEARGGYSKTDNFTHARADLFTRRTNTTGSYLSNDGTHQFTDNTSKSWNYRFGVTYVEPLAGKLFGELRYNYQHRFTDSDRSLYDLYPLTGYTSLSDFMAQHQEYGSLSQVYRMGRDALMWMDPAQLLNQVNATDLYAAVRDAQNSQYATYNYYTHNITPRLRFTTDAVRFFVGLGITTERTRLDYERPLLGRLDTVRNVLTLSPQLRFRYNFSKTRRLDINYRGSSTQPSMTNLLNVVDNSDPLNISVGNPGLKPSWNDSFRASYNGYNAETQRGLMANFNFALTRNAITNRLIYDADRGRSFTRPENISGNWNTDGGLTYNMPLDASRLFTLSTATNASFVRSVAYVSGRSATTATSSSSGWTADAPTLAAVNALFQETTAARSVARTLNLSEQLDLAYRRTTWDIALNGRVNYQHARASFSTNGDLDTWTFAYGTTFNLNLPSGLSLSTDLRMQSRRGFSAAAMNTNELLWNAQVSQSLLRDKTLTLSLQFYDILQQQSNISRQISATMRSDSWNNAINSYVMFHVIYKLNIFGGNKGAQHPDNRPDDDRGRGRPDGPRGSGMPMGPPSGRGPGGGPGVPMGW